MCILVKIIEKNRSITLLRAAIVIKALFFYKMYQTTNTKAIPGGFLLHFSLIIFGFYLLMSTDNNNYEQQKELY